MSLHNSFSFLKINFIPFAKSLITSKSLLLLLIIFNVFLLSCSPAKRFPNSEVKIDKEENSVAEETSNPILNYSVVRVQLNNLISSESIILGSSVYLYENEIKIASIKSGNTINCYQDNGKIVLTINSEKFEGEKFFLISADNDGIIKINGKRYRGKIQISFSGNSIDIINVVEMEYYVKGVLAKEMPLGKYEENFEALKALAVCIRTYAVKKMKDGKIYFDLYADTRDQVYGGTDAENTLSNKAVEETNGLILKYNGSQATIFYHSTCGGQTESSQNVFTKESVPYLVGIEDGSESYCKISPRYAWEETYSRELIISRLKNYSLLDNLNYNLEDISIISRFDSGRVNEMEIIVASESGEKRSIIIKGNEIRSIIRTADGKNILCSTLFDLNLDSEKIELHGKGFGHGVGLCQWGAIALSRSGWSFEEILNHYYPGTETGNLND